MPHHTGKTYFEARLKKKTWDSLKTSEQERYEKLAIKYNEKTPKVMIKFCDYLADQELASKFKQYDYRYYEYDSNQSKWEMAMSNDKIVFRTRLPKQLWIGMKFFGMIWDDNFWFDDFCDELELDGAQNFVELVDKTKSNQLVDLLCESFPMKKKTDKNGQVYIGDYVRVMDQNLDKWRTTSSKAFTYKDLSDWARKDLDTF